MRNAMWALSTVALATTLGCDPGPIPVIVGEDPEPTFDESGSWASPVGLPLPVWSPAAAERGGMIYVIGGYGADDMATASVVRIDPSSMQLERLADFPRPFADGALVTYRDTLLAIGGNGGSEAAIAISPKILWYDASNDRWEEWADLPERRFRHTAQVIGDAVLVAGGHGFNSPPDDSMAVLANRASSYAPPPRDFSYPLVSGARGDTLFIFSSFTNAKVLRYAAPTRTWLDPIGIPGGGAATGGIAGGRLHALTGGATPRHTIWDDAGAAWKTAPPPATAVTRAASVGVGDRFFLIGGVDALGAPVSQIQVYTPG